MDQATDAYLRAEFDDAIMLLRPRAESSARTLLAQSYLRANHFSAAAATARAAEKVARSTEEAAQALAVLAHALVRAGDLPGARVALERIAPCESGPAQASVSYARAFVAFAGDDIEIVEGLAAVALHSCDVNARIRARNLIAFVHSRRGDIERHAELLKRSFAEMGTDVYARANTIYQLSILARETAIRIEAHDLVHAIKSIPWTKHIGHWRFLAVQGLAWHYAVNGSYELAYRFAEDAIGFAPSRAWAVGAYADYAQFATAAGEKNSAGLQLSRALDLAEEVDWNACEGEERFSLLDLSVLVSRRNQRSAAHFLQVFDDLNALGPVLAFARESRARALRLYAGAMQVGVPAADAVAALQEAHRAFVDYNYEWRAAAAASALAEVTGENAWIDVAKNHLTKFPHSWLSQAVLGKEAELGLNYNVLSPQQRRVSELLLEGLSNREIAARLGLAHKTAQNHVQAVLDRLEVHSRKTLLAQHARRAS